MTDAAVISAEFVDFRMIKTRSVAQIICEVPIEQLPGVMDKLGWPQPSSGIPVAIAKLNIGPGDGNDRVRDPTDQAPNAEAKGQDKPRTPFKDLPRSQQAAIKCQDEAFQDWLIPESAVYDDKPRAQLCDECLKRNLNIISKRDLDRWPEAGANWDKVLASFDMRSIAR
jgi:hypothetical protein